MKSRPILFSSPMVRAILAGSKTQTRRVVKVQPPKNEDFPGSDFGLSRAIHQDAKMYTLNQYDALPKHATDWDLVGSVGVARTAGYPMVYRCPYGQPGYQLWVKETTLKVEEHGYVGPVYAESDMGRAVLSGGLGPEDDYADVEAYQIKKRPSIFMPRSMSRITLEITSVRVERLQNISEADAIAEGCVTEEIVSGYDGKIIKVPAEVPHPDGGSVGWDTAKDWYADLWESINGEGSWDANPWVWAVGFAKVKP